MMVLLDAADAFPLDSTETIDTDQMVLVTMLIPMMMVTVLRWFRCFPT